MPLPLHILVTGANGQLGMEFREQAALHEGIQWYFTGKDELSITNKEGLADFCSSYPLDYIINCAAYTAVDQAELEKDLAFAINAEGPGVLAEVCADQGIRLVHISTDYVFDGESDIPYRESDPTAPQNAYGASKLQGERRIEQVTSEAIIIRTSWVFGKYGKNFVKTMIRLMHERESISVVNDQQGSPTYAADLASTILHIITHVKDPKPGIYHYCNDGSTNWYAFASAIKELTGSRCQIEPIPTSAYPTPAKRPSFSLLDNSLIKETFGIKIPHWKDSLAACLSRLD